MNLQKQSYYSVSSSRAPIRNTADYTPFGIQLDGRTISYAPPAPAPPSVTVVYQHKFDDNPSTHPYTTAPNQLNTKLTNVNWTNSQSSWTNFAGFTGKAIATNSATPDTTRLYLNLTVNSGFKLDVKSYSFYHRSSTTGYTNYQLLVNGILVGSGSIFVSSGSTLQSTGTINVANAVVGLTGSVTVSLKLFGGSNGNNATFRLDDFTLNGYTQEVQVYAEGYRYAFNGMEKEDEVKGGGNSYDFGARMYDSRVGRWLSVDPLAGNYPNINPYCFVGNSPLIFNDPDGEKILIYYNTGEKDVNDKPIIKSFEYGSGLKPPNDRYVRKTIRTLDKIQRKGYDKFGIINSFKNSDEKNIGIHNGPWMYTGQSIGGEGATKQIEYDDGSLGELQKMNSNEYENGIVWNPNGGLLSLDGTKSSSAANVLLHELGHEFFDMFDPDGYFQRISEINSSSLSKDEKAKLREQEYNKAGDYDTPSDRWIIQNVESSFKNEYQRKSHKDGYLLKTKGGPFSNSYNNNEKSVKKPGKANLKTPKQIKKSDNEFN